MTNRLPRGMQSVASQQSNKCKKAVPVAQFLRAVSPGAPGLHMEVLPYILTGVEPAPSAFVQPSLGVKECNGAQARKFKPFLNTVSHPSLISRHSRTNLGDKTFTCSVRVICAYSSAAYCSYWHNS